MKSFTADFETTVDPNDCRVWAFALCSIENCESIKTGNSIDEFMKICEKLKSAHIYFHNLKFDGEFIISWLLNHGFIHVAKKEEVENFTFTTLISDVGQFYNITVYFEKKGKRRTKIVFLDSLKILNFSVEKIAKAFNLPVSKLKIDYKKKRDFNHELTCEEKNYIENDVKIMALALNKMFEKGLKKSTIGSDALNFYKKLNSHFNNYFPVLPIDVDDDIRMSYKGGFTYLNPIYCNKIVERGVVFDKNSMYPSKMVSEVLPVEYPVPFEGRYENDPCFPLYIQKFTCEFKIKPGKIPSLQIKNSFLFKENEYLTSSSGELVTLTLTSPDLELFFTQYEVKNLTFHGGWKFHGVKGLFSEYVNYWTEEKVKAKKENNQPFYIISKLMLNSLYGKFGLNPRCRSKIPYLSDGVVKYTTTPTEERDSIYCAVASFITSYARKDIIETSQAISDWSYKKYGENFYIYSDTDSIHMLIKTDDDLEELKKIIDVDDFRLGAWKPESYFVKAKFLRQKCYIEQDEKGKINPTVAGLPKNFAKYINFENFKIGFSTENLGKIEEKKLTYSHVKGGIILKEVDFTIK